MVESVFTEIVRIPACDVSCIEGKLEAIYKDVLRWAITSSDKDFYTISVTYIKTPA